MSEIFNQINTAELEKVRKRAISFLASKIPPLFENSNPISSSNQANNNNNNSSNSNTSSLANKDLEDLIIKHIKQVITN